MKKSKRTHRPEILAKYSNDTSPPYHCKQAGCEYRSDNPSSLAMHHHRLHSGRVPTWSPGGKPKRPSSYKPKRHDKETILKYSFTAKAPYHCKQCSFRTRKFSGLLKHATDMHGAHELTKRVPERAESVALTLVPAKRGRPGRNGGPQDHWQACPRCTKPQEADWDFCPKCGLNMRLLADCYSIAQNAMNK